MKKTTASKAKAPAKRADTIFKLNQPKAKRVSLAGDFNSWKTESLLGKKDARGNWTVKVKLGPGRYEYKFFVDGAWVTDPKSALVANTFGTQNSVVEIK